MNSVHTNLQNFLRFFCFQAVHPRKIEIMGSYHQEEAPVSFTKINILIQETKTFFSGRNEANKFYILCQLLYNGQARER